MRNLSLGSFTHDTKILPRQSPMLNTRNSDTGIKYFPAQTVSSGADDFNMLKAPGNIVKVTRRTKKKEKMCCQAAQNS